ncbi:MAG: NADH-quinone oxidoreductase subunit M [Phycisphaerales bacterium]|nr:NADH-quinone oxidoreductase subunit M [Phycisphaerales bacterium]
MLMIWISILFPVLAACVVALGSAKSARLTALVGTSVSLAALAIFAWNFPAWNTAEHFPSVSGPAWIPAAGITLSVGFDTVSLLLALLTAFLMPLCILGSFTAITQRSKEYYGWFLLLGSSIILAFAARDAILFYIGYEFTLVPMTLIIAIYGGTERRVAALKMFLYTFLGSMFMLASLLYVAWELRITSGAWNFDIDSLIDASVRLPAANQYWLFAALMVGFAVKVPLFPLHTWLPLAHDQAPTAGSVILASAMLKLGTYGNYRFALPMAPAGGAELMTVVAVLAIIAILYGSLICWVQTDAKKLVAYSSVAHLGLCMLGLFALNPMGAEGAVFYMVNHGLSTGALFFCIGMFYERYHTKDTDVLGGLAKRMPIWACFMVLFTLASIGLPGLNGFIGEFLCLGGAFTAEHDGQSGYPGVLGPWYAIVAGLGLIFSAMYLLILLGKLVWGPLREPHDGATHHPHVSGVPSLSPDLCFREIAILTPIAIACIWLGIQPKPMLDAIAPCAARMLTHYPQEVRRHLEHTSAPELTTTTSVNDHERATNE